MSTKLVGAVAIKVKPDTSSFRREADKGLDRELRGMDREIDVKAKVDADTGKARRQLADLKREADRTKLTVGVDVDNRKLQQSQDHLAKMREEMHSLSSLQREIADGSSQFARRVGEGTDGWAKSLGRVNREMAEWRKSVRATSAMKSAIKMEVDTSGFREAQRMLDKLNAATSEPVTIGSTRAGDYKAMTDQLERQVATLKDLRQSFSAKDLMTPREGENVQSLERSIKSLRERRDIIADEELAVSRLAAQWGTLGKAQRRITQEAMQADENLDLARAETEFQLWRKTLEKMNASRVGALRGEADAERGAAKSRREALDFAEAEYEEHLARGDRANKNAFEVRKTRLARELELQQENFKKAEAAQRRYDATEEELYRRKMTRIMTQEQASGTTITPEGVNKRADKAYADEVEASKRRLALEKLTAVELKKLQLKTNQELAAAQRFGIEAHRQNALAAAEATTAAAGKLGEDELKRHRELADRRDAQQAKADKNLHRLQQDAADATLEIARRLEAKRIAGQFDTAAAQKRENTRLANDHKKYLDSMADMTEGWHKNQEERWNKTFDGISRDDRLKRAYFDVLNAYDDATRDLSKKKFADLKLELRIEARGLDEAGGDLDAVGRWARGLDDDIDKATRSAEKLSNELRKAYLDVLRQKPGAKNQWAKLTVDLDKNSVDHVKRQAEKLREEIDDMEAYIAVNPQGLQLAAARFAYLTRPRHVDIIAKVNAKSIILAEGALMALAGMNIAKDVGRKFEKAFTELDTYALKLGKVAVAVGSVSAAVGSMTASMFSIGAGVVESIGLMALLPTAAMAAFTGFTVFSMGFNNFANAFSDIPIVAKQAMDALPPLAKKAVNELRGTWQGISDPVQEAFWGEMGDAVGQLKKRILPGIKEGFLQVAPSAAKFTKGVLDSFTKLADSGDMKTMFKNISGMFDNASGAAEPFFDAFNRFGLRGSEFLPSFGTWLTDIATQFDNWVKAADEAGDITRWIEQGVRSMRDMWKVGGSVIDMFKGISRAASAAGGPSLTDFADGIRGVADAMLQEPFQSRMTTLFEGANKGAGHLMRGVKDLGREVGKSAPFWAKFMETTSEIAGLSFTNISKVISNLRFQSGVTKGLEGFRDLTADLGPTFRNVGSIIGDIGVIAGGVFGGMSGIINGVTSAVAGVTGKLSDMLAEVSPLLTGQVAGTIESIGAGLGGLATLAGGAVGGFLELGSGLQALVVSAGAFALLRGSISKTISAFTNTAGFKNMQGQFLATRIAADKGFDSMKKYGAGTVVFGVAKDRVSQFATQVKASGTAMGGLKAAGTGLFNLMGGGWGVALMAGVTLMGLYSQSKAKARERTRSLKETLDQETGAVTENTEAHIANRLASEQLTGGADLFSVFNGQQGLADTAKEFGLAAGGAAEAIAKGGPEYERLIGWLKEGQALRMGTDNDAYLKWAESFGLAGKDISLLDFSTIIGEIEGMRGGITGGAAEILDMGDGVRKLDEGARRAARSLEDFSSAMKTMADETASAEDKTSALNRALAVLNGEAPDLNEATRNANDSLRESKDIFKDAEGAVISYKDAINKSTGEIDTAGQKGSDLSRSLQGVTDDVKTTAFAMKDSGKSVEDVNKYLHAQRDAWATASAASLGGKDVALKVYDAMAGGIPEKLTTTMFFDMTDAEGKALEGQALFDALDGTIAIMKITGNNQELAQSILNSKGSLEEIDKLVATAYADLDPTKLQEKQLEVERSLVDLALKSPTLTLGMDPQIFLNEEERVKEKLRLLELQPTSAKVDADIVEAQEKLDAIRQLMNENWEATALLTADAAEFEAEKARAIAAGELWNDTRWEAYLIGKSDEFIAARDAAVAAGKEFGTTEFSAYLKANPDPAKRSLDQAIGWLRAYEDDPYKATLDAANSGAVSAIRDAASKAKTWAAGDYKAWLEALDKTDPGTAAAIRAIKAMTGADYKAIIEALDGTGDGVVKAKRALNAIPDEGVTIQSAWGRVPAAPRIANLTTTIIPYWGKPRGSKPNPVIEAANGGIHGTLGAGLLSVIAGMRAPASVKAYADGGMTKPKNAHIAKAGSYVMYAEQETGGEAFIPLAATKRARSLEIWKETGRRLNAYADGGIEGGSAAAGTNQTFNITNHYPVAEKTSVTVNRALQLASVPGL